MAENANRERFEAMDRRFDMAEKRNQAAHAAICESIAKLDERTRTDTAALHERFDGLNGRFDDLYRHLLGAPATTAAARPRRRIEPGGPPPDSPRRSGWHAGCVHPH